MIEYICLFLSSFKFLPLKYQRKSLENTLLLSLHMYIKLIFLSPSLCHIYTNTHTNSDQQLDINSTWSDIFISPIYSSVNSQCTKVTFNNLSYLASHKKHLIITWCSTNVFFCLTNVKFVKHIIYKYCWVCSIATMKTKLHLVFAFIPR